MVCGTFFFNHQTFWASFVIPGLCSVRSSAMFAWPWHLLGHQDLSGIDYLGHICFLGVIESSNLIVNLSCLLKFTYIVNFFLMQVRLEGRNITAGKLCDLERFASTSWRSSSSVLKGGWFHCFWGVNDLDHTSRPPSTTFFFTWKLYFHLIWKIEESDDSVPLFPLRNTGWGWTEAVSQVGPLQTVSMMSLHFFVSFSNCCCKELPPI